MNPSHLFEGTRAENVKDATNKRRNVHGERQPLHKLTDVQVQAIRDEYAAGGVLQRDIAVKYGVSSSYISMLTTDSRRRRETYYPESMTGGRRPQAA